MFILINKFTAQLLRSSISLFKKENGLENLDFNEIKTLEKIDIIRKVHWLNKERYNKPLNGLYEECISPDHLWTIGELLKGFEIVDSDRYVKELNKISKQIESIWNLKPSDTIIVAIAEHDRPDGSQAFVHALGPELSQNWQGKIKNNIGFAFSGELKSSLIKNIVLADDYIGSGEKLTNKVKRLIGYLNAEYTDEFVIYVVALAGMRDGINNIKSTTAQIFVPIGMVKSISDKFTNTHRKNKAINSMIELEQEILPVTPFPKKKNFREYNFGYKLSESLYFQEGANIPNNVFPIFWKDTYENKTEPRYPLFRRSRK